MTSSRGPIVANIVTCSVNCPTTALAVDGVDDGLQNRPAFINGVRGLHTQARFEHCDNCLGFLSAC